MRHPGNGGTDGEHRASTFPQRFELRTTAFNTLGRPTHDLIDTVCATDAYALAADATKRRGIELAHIGDQLSIIGRLRRVNRVIPFTAAVYQPPYATLMASRKTAHLDTSPRRQATTKYSEWLSTKPSKTRSGSSKLVKRFRFQKTCPLYESSDV